MGKSAARRAATAGRCSEHSMFGCPASSERLLPYHFWEYQFEGEDYDYSPGYLERFYACITSKRFLDRWVWQQNRPPPLEKVEPQCSAGIHFRPDHWVERNGEVFKICAGQYDRRSFEYHQCEGRWCSMGYVKTCVFCEQTRGEASRNREARIEQIFGEFDDFQYICPEEGEQITFEVSKKELDCPICLEHCFGEVSFACSHSFCEDCTSEWTKRSLSCPLCRRKLEQLSEGEKLEAGLECDKAPVAEVPTTADNVDASSQVSEIAQVVADRPKRKHRGGVRNRKFIPGLCYLKFIPKKLRAEAEQFCGMRPCMARVAEFNKIHGIVPKHYKVLFVGPGAHVVKRQNWPAALQWRYLVTQFPLRRVGAEDWSDWHEQVLHNLEFPIDMMSEYVNPFEDIQYVERAVRAPGDCWKKLYNVIFWEDERADAPEPVTARWLSDEILAIREEWEEGYARAYVQWALQDDGDYHIERVGLGKKIPPLDDPKLTKSTILEFCEILRDNSMVRLVGKASKSTVDSAMALVTTPDVRSATEKLLQPVLVNNFEDARELCPWNIPEKTQHKANELNIPWSNAFATPHPHPLHAAIRRWAYLKEMPKHIRCDTTIVGMKDEHFRMLRSVVSDKYDLKLVNVIMDHKDISRFAGSTALSEDVFTLPKIETPGVLFDEQGHYFNAAFMVRLKQANPGIVSLQYTSIFPLEACEFDQSPEPDFCEWTIVPTKRKGEFPTLIYVPEGDVHGKYEQPFDPSPILMSKVEGEVGNAMWTGGVVGGKGHYRIHSFTSFNTLMPRYTITAEYQYIKLRDLFYDQPDCPPVRVDHFMSLFLYAKVITAKQEENIAGKLRLFVREEKLYFPPSAINFLIKYVMTAAKVTTVPDVMSRDVNSTGEEVYKATIGALVRVYKRLTTVRRCAKNAKLIDFNKPLYVYPSIKTVVSMTSDDNAYGMQWNVENDPAGGFWDRMKVWLKVLGYKFFSKTYLPVNTDKSGNLIFPHLAASTLNLRTFGPKIVRASQVAAFNEIYQKKPRKVVKPPHGIRPFRAGRVVHARKDEEGRYIKPTKISTKPSELERIVEDEEDSDDEDDSDGTASTIPTDASELQRPDSPATSVSSLQVEEEAIIRPDITADEPWAVPREVWSTIQPRCPDSISFLDYVRQGGEPVISAYNNYCDKAYAASTAANPTLRETLMGLVDRVHLRKKVEREGQVIEAPKPLSETGPRNLEVIDPEAKRALDMLRDDNQLPDKPVPPRFMDKYEERKAAFEKFYKFRPATSTFVHSATGETLWDTMFGMSTDRRHVKVPYARVIEYPTIEYPNNDCLLVAVSEATGRPTEEIFFAALRAYPREEPLENINTLPLKVLHPIGLKFGISIRVDDGSSNLLGMFGLKGAKGEVSLRVQDDHIKCMSKLNILTITRSVHPQKIPPSAELLYHKLNAWPAVQWYLWKPERKRASDLVRELRAGTVGLVGGEPINEEQLKRWDALTDVEPPDVEKYFTMIAGHPGCRKSSPAQKMLLDKRIRNVGNFVAIMPVKTLQDDWRDKLDAMGGQTGKKLQGDVIPTWERALAKDCYGYVAFTDENKFPKGYHALYHILNPSVKYHVFLCDPWQSSWHSPRQTALNNPSIPGEAEFYRQYSKCYLVGTWRFKEPTANFFRMPSFCKKNCGWYFMDLMPTTYKDLLVHMPHLQPASVMQLWEERVELYAAYVGVAWAEALRSSDAVSFAGSQGLSAGLTIIEIDHRVANFGSDPRLLYTAMTRSTHIIFVRSWTPNNKTEYAIDSHPILKHVEYYRQKYRPGHKVVIEREHTVDITDSTFRFPPGMKIQLSGPPDKLVNWEFVKPYWDHYNLEENFIDPDAVRVGARLSRDDPAYEDQHTFQAFIDETEDVEPDEDPPDDVAPVSKRVATKQPVEMREMFVEEQNAMVQERETAELRVKGYFSEQFPDTYLLRKDALHVMNRLVNEQPGRNRKMKRLYVTNKLQKMPLNINPLYFKPDLYNWGARQRNDDTVTWLAARQQRIRYADKIANEMNYNGQLQLGREVWNAFRNYMGWHSPYAFDQLYYEKAIYAFQDKRGSRSHAVKMGSRNRADMEYDSITIALKQQWKVKDRLFKAAKPGQPIMTHSDQYLFEHGPYGAYMLDKLIERVPDWFYFHGKKTIADYEVWNAKYMQDDNISEMTDLEGQDGTTQGWAVAFFENLLLWFGLPETFVAEWKRNKLSKEVNHKILAIMTGSGEIWTYLLNTFSSAALEIYRYAIPAGWPIAASGDDLRRKRGLPVNPDYEKLKHLDPTIVKRFQSARGEFISFMSVGVHVFKDPVILTKRFLAKISSGQGEDAILGYYDLWKWNYNKGEVLMSLLTEDEMTAHQIMTRVMFNLKAEEIYVRPDWTKISSAQLVSEEADQAAEYLSSDTIDLTDVAVEGRSTSGFVHSIKSVTLPFNISSALDMSNPLFFE